MPLFVGGEDSEKSEHKPTTVYADNSRSVDVTTEGILEGLKVVAEAFERNGLVEELKTTKFYHISKK